MKVSYQRAHKMITDKVHGIKRPNTAMLHQREKPGYSHYNLLLGENYTLRPQFRSHPNENNFLKVKASRSSETSVYDLTKYISRHILEERDINIWQLFGLEPFMKDKRKQKDATPPVQLHSDASVIVNVNTKLQYITTPKDSLLTFNVLMIHFNIITSNLSTKLKFRTSPPKLCIYFLILNSKLLFYQLWLYLVQNAKTSVPWGVVHKLAIGVLYSLGYYLQLLSLWPEVYIGFY